MADKDSGARETFATEAEINAVREAIRLNWAEMESSFPPEAERFAIRATMAELVQTIIELLGQLEPGEPAS